MPRGFASMSLERRREVQSKGGKAAQATGKCPRWNSEQAGAASKKARMNAKLKQEQKGDTCNTYHTTA